MRDLGSALGLMLALEGLAMAAFTDAMRKSLAEVSKVESRRLCWVGVAAATVGVIVVGVARGVWG